jgi:alpha-glucosidase
MTMLLPHHDGSPLYVSDPAPKLEAGVDVWVRVPEAARVGAVHVRTTPDGEPRFTAATPDRRRRGEVWWRGSVTVRNPVTGYRFLLSVPGGYRWLNAQGVSAHDVSDDTDFRLVAYDAPPAWTADAMVYQVFPDRFARSERAGGRELPDWAIPCDWDTPVIGAGPGVEHQVYGGDLDGIAQHLDHIQGLGADSVYLTPIFPARSNHRYDAAAFDRVDPLLGGDGALRRLADAVHARGMRLIGDLTTNHCGISHPWTAEPDLFYPLPDGGYESWNGVPTLPKFNWGSAELRRRFFAGPDAVATRWLSTLDGWRVDVANMTGRRGADDYAHEVARLMRQAVSGARPDALLVAEHAHDAGRDLDTGGWQGTMNYAGFTRPLWTWLRDPELDLPDFLGVPAPVPSRGGAEVVATMREFAARRSWRAAVHSWNKLGSHDTARWATVAGGGQRAEVGLGLLMTMPGVPMVFAGDEFGVRGTNGEDGRRPMPWGAGVLPWYPELIGLRRAHPALRGGGLRFAHVGEDALAYWRETDSASLLVLARRAAGTPVDLPLHGATNLYGGAERDPGDGPTLQVWAVE